MLVLLVPARDLLGACRRHHSHAFRDCGRARLDEDRGRRSDQHAAIAFAGETGVQVNRDRDRLQLRKVLVQHVHRIAVELRRVRVRVHGQEIAPPVVQAGHAMPGIKDRHMVHGRSDEPPDLALVRGPVAEGGLHLRLGGVAQVDDVAFAVSQHLDEIGLHGIRVPVGIRHLGDAALVGLVADHDGDGVPVVRRVGSLGRGGGQDGKNKQETADHDGLGSIVPVGIMQGLGPGVRVFGHPVQTGYIPDNLDRIHR